MLQKLLSSLAIISLLFISSAGLALASTGQKKVQEIKKEKQYLLTQLKKIDRGSNEYRDKRHRFQKLSRKLRTLLKRDQVKRNRFPHAFKKNKVNNQKSLNPSDHVSVKNRKKASFSLKRLRKSRIHPLQLKKFKTQFQKSSDGSVSQTTDNNSTVLGVEMGKASYYADFFNGRTTASGAVFSNNEMTAAHKTLKFGSRVRVTNLDNGKQIEVEITDRGPYAKGRIIDLTREGFSRLGSISHGVLKVKVETLSIP